MRIGSVALGGLVVLCVVAVGCGGSGSGGTGGGSAAGGGTSGAGGGTASTGGGTAGTGGGGPRAETGIVTYDRRLSGTGFTVGSGFAQFTSASGASGCTQSTVGNCSVNVCTIGASDGGTAPATDSAGNITITGGDTDGGIVLTYGTSTYGTFSSVPARCARRARRSLTATPAA